MSILNKFLCIAQPKAIYNIFMYNATDWMELSFMWENENKIFLKGFQLQITYSGNLQSLAVKWSVWCTNNGFAHQNV